MLMAGVVRRGLSTPAAVDCGAEGRVSQLKDDAGMAQTACRSSRC